MTTDRLIPSYVAERFLHPGTPGLTVAEVQTRADQITTSLEWHHIAPEAPTHVTVVQRTFPSGFYAARANRTTGVLSLATWMFGYGERLLLHELAHFAAPTSGHGPGWRATYLRLLAAFTWDPVAEAAGYDPGREQAERFMVGIVRGGLRLPAGHPRTLPGDLAHLMDPALADEAVADGIEAAFYARAANGTCVPTIAGSHARLDDERVTYSR